VKNLNDSTYFYVINYPEKEKELAHLEMKSLFEEVPTRNHFFSSRNISPSRSPFIKFRIEIIHTAPSLDELEIKVIDEHIIANNFKFERFKRENEELHFPMWIHSVTRLGKYIIGNVDMKNPSIRFGITVVNNIWVFGIYDRNTNPWISHNIKPHTNSNSLETRTARALVNISVGLMEHPRLVDPCCGIGTVVLEALSLGIPVTGYEISWIIANQARKNLAYFGYKDCIIKDDMNNIREDYDVAIIDLPYGHYSPISHNKQINIIRSSRHITKKLVLVTSQRMDEDIVDAGFTITDQCTVTKGTFVRFVTVCI